MTRSGTVRNSARPVAISGPPRWRDVATPAFVFDLVNAERQARRHRRLADRVGCQMLYALKPLTLAPILDVFARHLDGFAVSSLFEARVARQTLRVDGQVHLTSPGLRVDEKPMLEATCDAIAFNSLRQWENWTMAPGGARPPERGTLELGLRINPGYSVVDDPRYNPCRRHSKLGVPLNDLVRPSIDASRWEGISGLHFHTTCDHRNWSDLDRTVRKIEAAIPDWLERVHWINLGGGYLLEAGSDVRPLERAVDRLKRRFHLEVWMEPGASLARSTGMLVSSVIDLFRRQGREIAVLDTTVNHLPEVFEYQFKPDVSGTSERGGYSYLLVGGSCLAGDLFGEYSFAKPLRLGQRIAFPLVGAYSLVKAHRFNGINLPSIYLIDAEGIPRLYRRFGYEDYWNSGVGGDAAL